MDGGDGCTMWMYITLLNCTLKMVKMVFFTLYIFIYIYFITVNKEKEWPGEGLDQMTDINVQTQN